MEPFSFISICDSDLFCDSHHPQSFVIERKCKIFSIWTVDHPPATTNSNNSHIYKLGVMSEFFKIRSQQGTETK